jgi:hypothetical protein
MKDIAEERHISPALVGRLVKRYTSDGTMIDKLRTKEHLER